MEQREHASHGVPASRPPGRVTPAQASRPRSLMAALSEAGLAERRPAQHQPAPAPPPPAASPPAPPPPVAAKAFDEATLPRLAGRLAKERPAPRWVTAASRSRWRERVSLGLAWAATALVIAAIVGSAWQLLLPVGPLAFLLAR